jgi:hypothetical protein
VKMWAMLRDGTDWNEPGSSDEGGSRRKNKCEDLAALGQVSGSPPEDTGRELALSSVVGVNKSGPAGRERKNRPPGLPLIR